MGQYNAYTDINGSWQLFRHINADQLAVAIGYANLLNGFKTWDGVPGIVVHVDDEQPHHTIPTSPILTSSVTVTSMEKIKAMINLRNAYKSQLHELDCKICDALSS